MTPEPPVPRSRRARRLHHAVLAVAVVAAAYLGLAYGLVPFLWVEHDDARPRLSVSSMLTQNADGIPGDPINVALVGAKGDLIGAMAAAGWKPADPVTLRSSIEIGLSVVLDRPDLDAPVSPLFFDGRREDLAFEKQKGKSADQRQHVRFWRIVDAETTTWLGSASFDRGVGLSHDTGQITHHIAPDVDAERDSLMADLRIVCAVADETMVQGRGATREARNGEGDPYFTDGLAAKADLRPGPYGQSGCGAQGN